MPTAFLKPTPSFSVSGSLKHLPGTIGQVFKYGSIRLPKPSKTHRSWLLAKSAGIQLIVNASKFRFLYSPRLNPEVKWGCLLSANTRITEMNECASAGLFHLLC